MSQPEKLATAEWAKPEDVVNRHTFKPGAFWLGRSPMAPSEPIGYADDRHVCLVSGSRGGKGTTIILNNLCLWPGSLVVIDPKGENASVVATRRGSGSESCEGLGQKVHVLDPFHVAKVDERLRSRFNPLDAIDPADELAPDEVGTLVEALIVKANANDPYWDDSARQMLKVIILHVLTAPPFADRRNLLTVRRLITHGDDEFHKEMLQDEELQASGHTPPSSRELLWIAIANNEHYDGKISGPGGTFLDLYRTSRSQFESFLQVVNRNTEFIDSAPMQRCLATSDFHLSELKTRPEGVSLFVSLPDKRVAEGFRWLRMMVSLIKNQMEALPGRAATGHPLLMCLDEFASLKRMEAIENAVAQIAGYGVKLFFCLQTLEQLKATYPDKWETFLSNCGLNVFFNVGDHFSREYISKMIGETQITLEQRTVSNTVGESNSTTKGTSQGQSHGKTFTASQGTNESAGTSQSTGKSRNWGGNTSQGTGGGSSESFNWKLHPLFWRNTSRVFSLFRNNETTNEGTNSSWNRSRGRSWGKGDSFTEGSSTQAGSNESIAYGTNDTFTTGTNESTTHGTSWSHTAGKSEAIQKRPLVTPDEIALHFSARKDSPREPAYAIVTALGERPMIVRRANYFEDEHFIGYFEGHRDHPQNAPGPLWVEYSVAVPPKEVVDALYAACPHSTPINLEKWNVGEGDTITHGAPLGQIQVGFRGMPEADPEWHATQLPAPFSGTVTRIAKQPGVLQPEQVLLTLKVNRRIARRELSLPIPDCVQVLADYLQKEYLLFQRDREARLRFEREEREKPERAAAFARRAHSLTEHHKKYGGFLDGVSWSLFVGVKECLWLPKNPPDIIEAKVVLLPYGHVSIEPLAADGRLTPSEAIAYLNTALLYEAFPKLPWAGETDLDEVQTFNLALLFYASQLNRVRLVNTSRVQPHLARFPHVMEEARVRWQQATRE